MAAAPRIVEKIEGLLRKAERTTVQAERDTYLAGARRLMVKYAVTEAAINRVRERRDAPQVEEWSFAPDDRLLFGRRQLLVVACEMAGSGTRALLYPQASDGSQRCAIVGFSAERQVAKATYQSLVTQARDEAYRLSFTLPSFVDSFMVGFGEGVLDKLDAAEVAEVADDNRMALVLADRGAEVDDICADLPTVDAAPEDEVSEASAARAGYVIGQRYDLPGQGRLPAAAGGHDEPTPNPEGRS